MLASAVEGSPECCKLRADMNWAEEKVMGTTALKNANDNSPVTCTDDPATTLCKCNDITLFPKGCTLLKDRTVGGINSTCDTKNQVGTYTPDYKIQAWGMVCALQMLYGITGWIFIVLVALAAILIIFGAFSILTSGGNPEKVKSGRNMILYAAVGLLVALIAKAVPGVVRMISGF